MNFFTATVGGEGGKTVDFLAYRHRKKMRGDALDTDKKAWREGPWEHFREFKVM